MEYISIGLGLIRLLMEINSPEATPIIIDEWVHGRADYSIHENISEAEACKKAEARAKLNAIQSFNGEYIASDSFMSCKETGENVECPMHTFTWSMLDGLISGIRNKTVRSTTNLKEQRVCRVVLEARITSRSEPNDPNFDIQVELSNPVLKNGERLTIVLEPTDNMHVNILVEDHSHTLTRIFPNRFDRDNKIDTNVSIPMSGEYELAAEFPSQLKGNDAQEVVHVIATNSQLTLLDAYSLEDFNLKLAEIPNNKKRYVRKAYRIVR